MGFSACASVVLCQHHSTNAQYSSLSYQKDKQAKHGGLQTKQCSFRYWGSLYRRAFPHSFFFKWLKGLIMKILWVISCSLRENAMIIPYNQNNETIHHYITYYDQCKVVDLWWISNTRMLLPPSSSPNFHKFIVIG